MILMCWNDILQRDFYFISFIPVFPENRLIYPIYMIQNPPHQPAKDPSKQSISILSQYILANIPHPGPAFAAFNLWHLSHYVVQTFVS